MKVVIAVLALIVLAVADHVEYTHIIDSSGRAQNVVELEAGYEYTFSIESDDDSAKFSINDDSPNKQDKSTSRICKSRHLDDEIRVVNVTGSAGAEYTLTVTPRQVVYRIGDSKKTLAVPKGEVGFFRLDVTDDDPKEATWIAEIESDDLSGSNGVFVATFADHDFQFDRDATPKDSTSTGNYCFDYEHCPRLDRTFDAEYRDNHNAGCDWDARQLAPLSGKTFELSSFSSPTGSYYFAYANDGSGAKDVELKLTFSGVAGLVPALSMLAVALFATLANF